jgi:hypothetical protein
MEDYLKELSEYKRLKLAEEQEIKIKANKLKKKSKLLTEKEASIEIETSKLEKDKVETPHLFNVEFVSLDYLVSHEKTEHVQIISTLTVPTYQRTKLLELIIENFLVTRNNRMMKNLP